MMGTWLPETCWATIRREIKNTKVTSSWFFISTHPGCVYWIIQSPNFEVFTPGILYSVLVDDSVLYPTTVYNPFSTYFLLPRRQVLQEYTRLSQSKTLNMFHLVIYRTRKGHDDFIFLCSIVLPPDGHSSNHDYHCWNLQGNRAVVRTFIALLRFSSDFPSQIHRRHLRTRMTPATAASLLMLDVNI